MNYRCFFCRRDITAEEAVIVAIKRQEGFLPNKAVASCYDGVCLKGLKEKAEKLIEKTTQEAIQDNLTVTIVIGEKIVTCVDLQCCSSEKEFFELFQLFIRTAIEAVRLIKLIKLPA